MKKNLALRTAAVLFILAVITGCFASAALAKNAGLEHGFAPYSFAEKSIVSMTVTEEAWK